MKLAKQALFKAQSAALESHSLCLEARAASALEGAQGSALGADFMARFEELDVWKRAACLSAELYKSLKDLKDFGFKDQITRAGLSIPSNIAEGYERSSSKELANFLSYAKGSAGELRTPIYIGMEVGYIERESGKLWLKEAEEISRMLHALILRAKEKG